MIKRLENFNFSVLVLKKRFKSYFRENKNLNTKD